MIFKPKKYYQDVVSFGQPQSNMMKKTSVILIKAYVLLIVMTLSSPTVGFESIDKCLGVNIMGSSELVGYYVSSIKYLQHSIVAENLGNFRVGSGLSISLSQPSTSDSSSSNSNSNHYSYQIRFKHYLVICCMSIQLNLTNVREYDVKLLDKTGAYILPPSSSTAIDPTKFTADANLFVDMSRNAMGSYGLEISIKRTQPVNDPPSNVVVTLILCEKTANVSERARQQQAASAAAAATSPMKTVQAQLFEYCTSDDQCDRLIGGGEARCVNNSCQCRFGAELNKYQCPVTPEGLSVEDISLTSDNINFNVLNR